MDAAVGKVEDTSREGRKVVACMEVYRAGDSYDIVARRGLEQETTATFPCIIGS
jgi:hypothetical protein